MRKFLYTVVFLIILVGAGLFLLRLYADELTETALIPDSEFVAQAPLEANAYTDPAMWFSRPGKSVGSDPSRWQPAMVEDRSLLPSPADPSPTPRANASAPRPAVTPMAELEAEEVQQQEDATPLANVAPPPDFVVFFVHPTSFYNRASWNGPLDDKESQNRARLMIRGMASAFNQASEVWAPRYRQATFGAFITDAPEAQQALDVAYADISQAFDFFLESIDPDVPIVLAGHSQGGYLISRLLEDRVAGTPLQQRVAMAYPIGWPLSIQHDLPSLGLSACATPDQPSCVMSWASFAEPAEPGQFFRRYATTNGFDGEVRGESPILCVNPITGTLNDNAEMALNLGTLVPNADLSSGELVSGAVPARCDPATGLLLIGEPPEMGKYVLPGNNYHVYDIPLFWQNLRYDVVRRVEAWTSARS